jgi:hypothetical protein
MTNLQKGLAIVVVGQILVIGSSMYSIGYENGIEHAEAAYIKSKQLTGQRPAAKKII